MAANGQMINHYRILKPIGKGGMGEVFLAEDTILERKVAIKFLPESVQQDSDMRKRFLREAKAAAGMDHPNICRVYETGEFEGRSFIVMEYVAGETLKDRLLHGPIPLKEAIPLACEIAEAIQGAHECGIIHRDLKPANIMLMPQGHPKIMDFGLAKQIGSASNTAGLDSNASTVSLPPVRWDETGETQGAVTQEHAEQPDKDAAETVPPDQDYANNSNLSTISDAFPLSGQSTKSSSAVPSDLTKAGTLLGTIDYMSPERARCERLDVRSDIFAFGVVLYEMLTGRNPFHRQSTIQTLSAILRDAPDIPQKQAEGASIPHRLQQVLNKSMAKDSSERYQSMKEMETDLQAVREDLLPRKRPAWVSWVLSVAAVLVVALGVVIWWYASRDVVPAPQEPISVLITDFDNRTDETVWNETLEEALQVGLEEAPNVSSYRRSQALKTAQELEPDVTGLNEEAARLISQREGIDIIITGFIENSRSDYRLGVQTQDAIKGEIKDTYQKDADSRDTVFNEMAKLAVDVRKDLGDKEADASKLNAKETFTSSSLEAVKSYVTAQNYQDESRWQDALDAYRKAIELDPDFGRAYAGAGIADFRLGNPAESEEYFKEAMKRTDRMTAREKYRTIGNYYLLNRNYSPAIKNYNDLVDQYPADGVGYNQLAYAYLMAGDTKMSLEFGQTSFDMDPSNVTKRGNLALYAMYAGDFDTAETRSAEVILLNPTDPYAYICQAIAQIMKKDLLKGRQSYGMLEEVDGTGASLALIGFADLAIYEGRLQEATSLLEKYIAENQAKDVSYYAAIKQTELAGAYLQLKQKNRAVSAADKAVAARNDNRFLYEAAMIYLQTGRSAQALELAKALKLKLEPEPQAYAHIIEAREMSERDVVGAVRMMLNTLDKDLDCWLARFELGRIYLENGKPVEALDQFGQCLTRLGEATAVFLDDTPTLRYIPLIYYNLGRAYAGAGNTSAASENYNKFLAIKAGGNEDPLVEEVRERLAAL